MSPPLRLALLTGPLEVTAENIAVLDLATALKHRGHRVGVLAGEGPLLPRFRRAGVNILTAQVSGSFLLDLPRLKSILGDVSAATTDLLHVTDLGLHRHGAFLSRIAGLPWIVSAKVAPGRRLRRSGRLACVVVPSNSVRDALVAGRLAPRGLIRIVRPGVDPSRFPAPVPPFTSEGPVLGVITPLERRAGARTVIEAVRLLIEEGRRLHLLIAGTGREDRSVRRLARVRGVSSHVTVTALPGDFERVVTTLDIALFPAGCAGYEAGLPQVMAAARPVVATGVGAAFSWVSEGVTGFLVPHSDPVALAARTGMLLDDHERAVEIGLAGRRSVLDGGGMEEMVAGMEAAYHATIDGGPAR